MSRKSLVGDQSRFLLVISSHLDLVIVDECMYEVLDLITNNGVQVNIHE